jgi:hypothetical protein
MKPEPLNLTERPAYERTQKQVEAAAAAHPPNEISLTTLISCLLTSQELGSISIPKRKRLIGKWLCEGDLGYVFAPRGVGKTWLAMALPAAISQGRSLGLWEAGEDKARVLYLDGEMPLELTQYRSKGLHLDEGDLTYLHHETLFDKLGMSINIGDSAHRNAITQLLVQQGFQCLILDNLSSLASGVEENRGEHYEPISHWLLDLRRRKITVIVVHHAGRNAEVMRGHSKREDACSWIIQLRDAKSEGEHGAKFISHFAKPSRNTGEPLSDLLWHFTTDEQGEVKIDCVLAQTSEFDAFVRHVRDGVESVTEIAELMDKPKGTISKWGSKAVKEGLLLKKGGRLLPANGVSLSFEDEDDD